MMLRSVIIFLPFLVHCIGYASGKTKSRQEDDMISKLASNISLTGDEDISKIKALTQLMESKGIRCHGIHFKQTVRRKGCKEEVVANKLCFGSCVSKTTPQIDGEVQTQPPIHTCGPGIKKKIEITFSCPNNKKEIVSFDVIKSCHCKV